MIFIIPFIFGAIGLAVGAVGGAFAAHALGEKDRQKASHHRKVENELNDKYSQLKQRYYELGDKSKAEIKELNDQLALSEIEKDTLHLVVELQQAVIGLMVSIDSSPTYKSLTEMHEAVKATNHVLSHLDKTPIAIASDYFERNLKRITDIEGLDVRELIKPKLLSTIKYGSQISIKTYDGRYVTSDLENYGKLSTKAEYLGECERFEIIDATNPFSNDKERVVCYGDKIAFRAIANSKFVCSDLTNYGKLSASAPHVKEWETFVLFPSSQSSKKMSQELTSEKMGQELTYRSTFTLHVHNNQQVIFSIYGWTCIVSPSNDIAGIFVFG